MSMLVLCAAAAVAPSHAQPPPPGSGYSPTLLIYSARGASDSCGKGCDRWIAIEGRVDNAAAARVEQFLAALGDSRRPVYFHSPGGEGSQAFAIARLLRARNLTARIGRTVVDACPGGQTDDACVMIKSAGHERRAHIAFAGAMCNSACGLMFFGATTREVGPGVVFGVHNAKIVLDFKQFVSERQRDEAMAKARAKSDRDLKAFIAEMGIGPDLFDLIETVSYENKRLLTRDELHRFRIDPRSFGETPWTVETGDRPFVRKAAFARHGGRFVDLEWRLTCAPKNHAALLYGRDIGAGAGAVAVAMSSGTWTPARFIRLPRSDRFEVWGAAIPAADLAKLFAAPSLQVGEVTPLADGGTSQNSFEIGTGGLETAWRKVEPACTRMPPPGQRRPMPPPFHRPGPGQG
ncbi:hypothetical protein ACTZWT_07545 [Rhodopseudomonas sp. NSM]|uniref:hypothetical protein n=1 Tax=Rhodopseudomonas sp. NSM TaxID=3457630 RepID=UPI00403580EB